MRKKNMKIYEHFKSIPVLHLSCPWWVYNVLEVGLCKRGGGGGEAIQI